LRTVDDIGNIVIKEHKGVPLFVRDLAEVRMGEEVRQGAIIKGGYTESVSGIVLMARAGNAKEIVTRVKAKVAQINDKGMLPDGLQIVPFYDRTELVDSALWTVAKVLMEGILLVVVVLFIFLGDVRSSLIVVATLIITPLTTFILMNRYGISANLMSLGGLAIAIGLMVDATVVVVENVFHRLGQAKDTGADRVRTILNATMEVAVPTLFGIAIIILVFLPLMTLQGIEGKLFMPLALTIAMSLAVSLAVSLFLSTTTPGSLPF
jgi:heavy metal efflux system protein